MVGFCRNFSSLNFRDQLAGTFVGGPLQAQGHLDLECLGFCVRDHGPLDQGSLGI